MTDLTEFISELPKCELHVHIEGTLEPELKFALAARNNVPLPYADADEMRAGYVFHDLPSFLACYYEGMSVLLTEADFYDLAWAYLNKAKEQNIRYAEIFFDPQAHTSRGVAFDTVIRGLRRALMDARRLLDVRAQLIMCFMRDFSAEYAMATLMESLRHREWIIGVGLDSDERDNPPAKFAAVFARARAEGYQLTMHCDLDQKNSLDHIRQCLDVIGVDRIDHGVNCLESEDLQNEIKARGLGLTVCPVSNSYVRGSDGLAVVRKMLDGGLRVTVSSDDPAYMNGYVTENLLAVQAVTPLTPAELVQLQRNAFDVAWLPDAVKETYLAELASYCAKRV
ncbi:adenosine deaminase [Streptomyces sp. 3213]|uniref:adenosine deaminase n=1 Tax=Streptomyces sp. 3213.3 TaxID=1855348 RepID=UPI0008996EA7|nr:adenosine deaminase [Streptomyces sp. 3213.3]SEC67405.1 adenosine deaminase [Streptomyces sp. 3213] [Streptomyces sp. 3213.3]